MAFTLVTTIGGKTSNSLVTLEEAEEYLASSPCPLTGWNALEEDAQNYRLILAAKFMTSRLNWKGWKLHEKQALCFPRFWHSYKDGSLLSGVPLPFPFVYGSSFSPGDLFPTGLEAIVLTEMAQSWWTDERIAEYDVIPEDIKITQAFMAAGPIHAMLKGVTDPESGLGGTPEIKSLGLFGGKLSITTADRNAATTDSSYFEQTLKSQHNYIYLLIEDWLSQISCGPEPQHWPSLLPEVA